MNTNNTTMADIQRRVDAFEKNGKLSEDDMALGYMSRGDLYWELAQLLEAQGNLKEAADAYYQVMKGLEGGNPLPSDPDRASERGWRPNLEVTQGTKGIERIGEAKARRNAVLDRLYGPVKNNQSD